MEDMREEHKQFQDKMNSDISDVKSAQTDLQQQQVDDRHLNFIIKNLEESRNENVMNKVNGLIKDGLKIKDIKINKAERKGNRGGWNPGVIVPSCRSVEDKRKIMSEKKILRDSSNFSRVYILSDKPLQMRIIGLNMRVLAKTVGDGQLRVTGTPNRRQQPPPAAR